MYPRPPSVILYPFVQSLLDGLRQRSITAVRVAGPHGACDATLGCQLSPPDSWLRYDSLLLIGGGVGVSGSRRAPAAEAGWVAA